MIGGSPNGVKIMVATQPIDFRRGMNGLVALVASALSADPYCGDVFVFRAKRLDRLRCIYWDGSGMILATKARHLVDDARLLSASAVHPGGKMAHRTITGTWPRTHLMPTGSPPLRNRPASKQQRRFGGHLLFHP